MAGQRSAASRRVLERAGLVTFDEAVRRGIASAREKPAHESGNPPTCRDARCVLRATGAAALDALRLPWDAVRSAAVTVARLPRASRAEWRDAFREAVPLRF